MIKIISIFLTLLLFNCSLDTKSGIWTNDREIEQIKINEQKIFEKDEIRFSEFNINLSLDLSDQKFKTDKNSNTNNSGRLEFNESIKKTSKFKFKKIDRFNQFEPELASDGSHFVFFDDKLNILKFNKDFKLKWKKNFYKKKEIKDKPLLWFSLMDDTLIITDTIGNIFNIDFNSGNINWNKRINNPFNSQIKIYDKKIFTIDLNNVVRCFSLNSGKELWRFNSENTFLKSDKRKSIAIKNDVVFFNNSIGDITALNVNDGSLIWQIPTQTSSIYENTFSMETSDIVISDNDLYFSNNRNEFYSISSLNGILNWKQSINSSIKPIIVGNFVFSLSNEGFLFVMEKQSGNIIKVTDVFDIYKSKKRKNIHPIGFIIGKNNFLVTTNMGRLLIIDTASGKTKSEIKIDNSKISRPFVFDKNILIVKDNAVVKLN